MFSLADELAGEAVRGEVGVMKKGTRYCDVCGEELAGVAYVTYEAPPIDDVHYLTYEFWYQRRFASPEYESHLRTADLCDQCRLRVLEAAVAQVSANIGRLGVTA